MEYNEEKQPVLDTNFWAKRLAYAYHRQEIHRAIFECTIDEWTRASKIHAAILKEVLKENTSILDCGCGWGRLIDLINHPLSIRGWNGKYLGLDICPDFIRIAQLTYPIYMFAVADLLQPLRIPARFDLAVMISIRPMITRNLGIEAWRTMEYNVRQIADKILFLEYGEESYELN